jgi:hypothetical protein
MTNGKISGNNGGGEGDCLSYGNGVAVHEGGFFEMTGGVITGNRGSRFGGGVWVGGFFNMSGNAMIANNYNWTSCTGCGVYNEGSFIMSGNSMITNNTAFCGGGVYNAWQGSFVMTDNSMITNNTASMDDVAEDDLAKGYVSPGGGVSNWGSFEMSGGIISGNKAWHGGGVCIHSSGSFVLSGSGMIVNNTADRGGGVHVGEEWSSEGVYFEMSGGVISGNFAESDYGGVYSGGSFSHLVI